jgi:hypothetical protein
MVIAIKGPDLNSPITQAKSKHPIDDPRSFLQIPILLHIYGKIILEAKARGALCRNLQVRLNRKRSQELANCVQTRQCPCR